MKELKRLIHRIAPHDVHTYIEGLSGSGKELVATRIHSMSQRNNEHFVTINCGAIPDTLIESEFFGYEKGAFTGAVQQRLGKFELANNGTLFLDEVADLSPHAQAALLRVIQQKEVVRVGGHKTIPLNVRILSASNQNLEQLIEQGLFRADLYFRLSEMVIPVPALNLRTDDIPLLIMEKLNSLSIKINKQLTGVSHHFLERLLAHSWPGNVRELEHVLTRAAILEDGMVLEGKSFNPDGSLPDLESSLLLSQEKQKLNSIAELRFQMAKKALFDSQGNKSLAAKSLKISRPTFYSWLKKADK
jgi:transcriptional regulator with PAS, ATPase and Fis domain